MSAYIIKPNSVKPSVTTVWVPQYQRNDKKLTVLVIQPQKYTTKHERLSFQMHLYVYDSFFAYQEILQLLA